MSIRLNSSLASSSDLIVKVVAAHVVRTLVLDGLDVMYSEL